MSDTVPRLVAPAAAEMDSAVPSGVTPGDSLPSALPPPTPPVLPAIPGYEVMDELGRGGMGVVYKARHLALNRVVALKMILAGAYAGPEEIDRLRKEAEALGRLQHPNIVQIFEVGEMAGRPFCALEYVEGGALDGKLAGKPQPPREAAALLEILARAVHAAHQRRVVHRDLKPQNILLAADGTPKITDFGLAKRLDEEGRTASGAVMGTPSYMAPEQARGRAGEVGPGADIYALGALLYQLLTGRPPFRAETPLDTMLQVLTVDPMPPRQLQPDAPRDLETICLKCLQKEPERRYATALALADDLRRFLDHRPILVRRVGLLERTALWARRRPAAALATGLVLLAAALALGGGTATWFWFGAEQARKDADHARQGTETALGQAQAAQKAEGLARQAADRALQTAEDAKKALAEANDKLDQTSYLFKVDLAFRDLLSLQFGRTDRLLEECPPARRQWEWRFVRGLRRSCIQSLRLPAETPLPSSMAATADGARVAVAWENGEIQVWDLRSGKKEATWNAPPLTKPLPIWRSSKGVVALAFNADGGRLVGGLPDDTIRIWDCATGKVERSFTGALGDYGSPAFSPDGKELAVPLFGGPIKIWNIADGREKHSFEDEEKGRGYNSVVFSANGKRLAAGGLGGKIAMWDLESDKSLIHRAEDKDVIVCPQTVFFNAAGDALRYVTLDRGVSNVLAVGADAPTKVECASSRDVDVALAPDGRRLVVLGKDNKVEMWDVASAQATVVARWPTSEETQYSGFLKFTADGSRLIDVCNDQVYVWDTAKPYPQRRLPDRALLFAEPVFSRDDRRFAAGHDAAVEIWDTASGRAEQMIESPVRKPGPFFVPNPYGRPLAFSPDGRRLAGPTADGVVLWDVATGKAERTLHSGDKEVEAIAWGADDRLTVVLSGGDVCVWDVKAASDEPTHVWHSEMGFTSGRPRLTPDGAYLAADSVTPEVWDVKAEKRIATLKGDDNVYDNLAISSDGKRVAAVSMAASTDFQTWTVRLTVWDRKAEKGILRLDVGDATPSPQDKIKIPRANAYALSPDGERVAVALKDGTVQLWDVATGREALVTRQRGSEMMDLRFSLDGRYLACVAPLGEITLLTAEPDGP